MLHFLKQCYDYIPVNRLKFLRFIPDRVLFGESYSEWRNNVSFDKANMAINLADTLNYSRMYTRYGENHIVDVANECNAIKILESLPLVSSYDLSNNLDYYISREFKGTSSYLTTTGGTGRNPTAILLSNESFGIEWAHIHNIWSSANYQKSQDLKLTLRGKSLKGDRLVEFNPVYNELVVDTFRVNNSNFESFLREINKYNIKYIHGYPSLLKEFMVYFEKYGCGLKLEGVFLGSESASVKDKEQIASFFDCKVLHWYGQSEKVALAVDVNANNMFRVFTSYGYPRVVDGELVATSFVNRALPLINYMTGDGADVIEDDRHIYLTNITSRRGKDFVYLNRNKRISTTAINLHSQIQSEILYYQIHQCEFGKVEIRVLQKETSKMKAEKLLKKFGGEMSANLKDFTVDVRLVDENAIVKSHRGKMILLVQNIKI